MKSIKATSALFLFAPLFFACGQQAASPQTTAPETAVPQTPAIPDAEQLASSVVPGMIFAENAQTKLFSGQRADGTLDFLLWKQDVATGKVSSVTLPVASGTLVIGAALDEQGLAYVATRTTSEGVEHDVFFRLNLATGDAQQILSNNPQEFVGTEVNSLTVRNGVVRFFALRPSLVEGQHETELGLFRLDGARVVRVESVTDEAKMFNQALVQAQSRNLAAQRIRAQAVTFLRFPKTLASHRTSGSRFHTGQDLYAADLNRGGGDTDIGDGVVAAQSGQVVSSYSSGAGYGEYITVLHTNGLTTAYAHLSKRVVAAGANVYSGQYIGNVGKSGGQTYAHLHFVLRNGGSPMYIASASFPMATTASGYGCPLSQDMPFDIDFSPASC